MLRHSLSKTTTANGMRAHAVEEELEDVAEEEDPEEVAFRERLRKLAEEDENQAANSTNETFSYSLNSNQNNKVSEDKLTQDAQRALEILKRTKYSSIDQSDDRSLSIWTDNGIGVEEEDDDAFRVQQARLKALAAAAQPASHVRQQASRQTIPKPPGLEDPEKKKREEERKKRLAAAETAAVLAVTKSSEDVKVIHSHIMANVKAEEPASSNPPEIRPSPGLGFLSKLVKSKQQTTKPEEPEVSKDTIEPPSLPVKKVSSNQNVFEKKSSNFVEIKKSNSNNNIQSLKSRVSNNTFNYGDNDFVVVYENLSFSRGFLNQVIWKYPLNAMGWILFGILFCLAAYSRNWSTLTIWALFALLRVFIRKGCVLLEQKLPSSITTLILPIDYERLPGSFKFSGEIVSGFAKLIKIMSAKINDQTSVGIFMMMFFLGFSLNLAIAFIVLIFLFSLSLSMYKAIPQVFENFLPHQALEILQKL